MSDEQLILCADNLFNTTLYPNHTVSSADATEVAGYESWHVATGRRAAQDRWQGVTANSTNYVQVTCDKIRGANFWAMDRGGNLITNVRDGNTSNVEGTGSDDSFTTTVSLFDINLPQVPGGALSGAAGCLTTEDAWLKTVTADAHHGYRFQVRSLGAGVTPQVVGLWLGTAWAPSTGIVTAYEDRIFAVEAPESVAVSGWRGRGRAARPRSGTLSLRPRNEDDYDHIQFHIFDRYMRGFPMWLVFASTDSPQDAMLVQCPNTTLDWGLRLSYPYRALDVPFVESQASY